MRSAFALIAALNLLLAACAPQQPAEPALWRISDADSEIWLFGSVHVLPPDLAWRSARLGAAFARADELIVETDPDPEKTATLAARYGALPPGQTLSSLLRPAEAERLHQIATQLQIAPAALESKRPWLAALQLSFAFAVSRGHRAEAGVENVLLPEARAVGKRVGFLETPEQQIRALADLPEPDQLRFLSATLQQIESGNDTLEQLDAAWASGDLATLDRLQRADLNEAGPALYAAIITNRNANWAAQIAQRLEGEGRTIYVVGAAHLSGEGGVVALLRERGIAVDGP